MRMSAAWAEAKWPPRKAARTRERLKNISPPSYLDSGAQEIYRCPGNAARGEVTAPAKMRARFLRAERGGRSHVEATGEPVEFTKATHAPRSPQHRPRERRSDRPGRHPRRAGQNPP